MSHEYYYFALLVLKESITTVVILLLFRGLKQMEANIDFSFLCFFFCAMIYA